VLPTSFELPAAIALVMGGAVACFAGYRLFRLVLAIYGFIAGAMIASATMASTNTVGMLVAALVGGVVGAVLLFFAYFVAIALVGAGAGAFVVSLGWSRFSAGGDPPWMLVLLFAAFGTVAALLLQRYVIIVATSFSGAWSIIIGTLALTGNRQAARATTSDVWILYPFTPIRGASWVPLAWVALGIFGMAIQLGITGKKR
jgi:hypothetical protein